MHASAMPAPFLDPKASTFQPSPQSAQLLPTTTMKPLCELREASGKGHGLFATAAIPRGTMIHSERPFIVTNDSRLDSVWKPYLSLNATDKDTYDAMRGYHYDKGHLAELSRLMLLDRTKSMPDQISDIDEHVRVMAIFACSNILLDRGRHGVFKLCSRINHSCLPNVFHCYNSTLGSVTVFATNNIEPGEELLSCYLGSDAAYLPRLERQKRLLPEYGFTCACLACSEPTGISDGRRELMGALTWGLKQFDLGNPAMQQQYIIPRHDQEALSRTKDILTLMLMEGLTLLELSSVYQTAARRAILVGSFYEALEYAEDALEVERNCLGTEVAEFERTGVAAVCLLERIRGEIARIMMG